MKQVRFTDRYAGSFFENNIDLYNYIRKREKEGTWEGIARNTEAQDWAGGVTYEEAMNNLLYGNKDTTAKFIDGLKDINQEEGVYSNIFLDTEGFAYEIGSVVAGNPECCLNWGALETKKSITISMDYTAPGYVNEKCLRYRNIALVNLLYTLKMKGYIINLKMCEVDNLSYTGTVLNKPVDKHMISVNVPLETFSVGTIAFYCSTEYFRIIMLLVETMCVNRNGMLGRAQGSTNEKDYLIEDKNTWLIPSAYMDKRVQELKSQQEADEYVKKLFDEYCASHNLEA